MATIQTNGNVSVYIPVYNQRAALLERAIDSALSEGVSEVLVIDDGSTPPVLARRDRVRIVRHAKNEGVPSAFNTMLDAFRTVWVVRLGSDDELIPGILGAALSHAHNRQAAAVFWDYVEIPEGAEVTYHGSDERSALFSVLKTDNVVYGGASMLHWSALALAGPQRALRYCHDWDYHLRVQQAIGWSHVPRIGTRRGVYPWGLTKTADSRELNRQRAEVKNAWASKQLCE